MGLGSPELLSWGAFEPPGHQEPAGFWALGRAGGLCWWTVHGLGIGSTAPRPDELLGLLVDHCLVKKPQVIELVTEIKKPRAFLSKGGFSASLGRTACGTTLSCPLIAAVGWYQTGAAP